MRPGHGLEALFQPRSIAIVGASQDATKIGGRPVHLLLKHGYGGAIWPVNPRGGELQGLPAFASVDDLPQAPDLALVALEAERAPEAAEQCIARGARGLIVFSSGFAELGDAGHALQQRLTEAARRSGCRILGPNCLGAASIADRSIASFSVVLEERLPPSGDIAIVSQSGNLGSYAMRLLGERGAGVSRFLTTGNECDVDIADGIAWLARDPATRVILACLETCRDAPRLLAALSEARRNGKPVIVLKIGTSAAGQTAASSHTGAMAGVDAVFDAVFRRYGVVRVDRVEELVSVGHAAAMLAPDRLPRGPRVGLVAASGGFGVMLADAAARAGLEVPPLGEATQRRVLEVVPFASGRNPVDATAQMSSRPQILQDILSAVVVDDACDAVIVLLLASLTLPRLRDAYLAGLRVVRERHPERLVVLCARGPRDAIAELDAMGYPTFDSIDGACRALSALARLRQAMDRPDHPAGLAEPTTASPLDPQAGSGEVGAKKVLAGAGIPVLTERLVHTAEEAAEAAAGLGFPVVLKVASRDLAHKTEVGGVALGLRNAGEVREAHDAILDRIRQRAPAARIDGLLVAPQATGVVELILGTVDDPMFGPVVMVGLGGIYAEIMNDRAVALAPVSEGEAEDMIRSLKAFPVLDGARGRPKADVAAASRTVAALSHFAATHVGSVAEIDINPFLLRRHGEGAVALDALIVPRKETS